MNADTPCKMDMISDRLVELGMTHWLPVLHRWLRQYRGPEDHIDCREDWPEYLVIECLDTHLASNTRPASDAELGDTLSRLDFLTWRVRHEDGERWKPLEETYESFVLDGVPITWQWDTEIPEPPVTQAYFAEQLEAIKAAARCA